MKVQLLNYTPLQVCANAIRTCWQSFDKSDSTNDICGEADKALIDRVGNQFKHASTLEHLNYNFYISGISRACLQELARHRMASLSVKSTRYTLKELKEDEVIEYEKFLVFTGIEQVDNASKSALDNLRSILQSGTGNDMAKYCLPESYKTELTWSINARSLQNFLHLRSSKAALWEIRELAKNIYNALPKEHKYLFELNSNESH
jgi:thymidylate synthase (FAD)